MILFMVNIWKKVVEKIKRDIDNPELLAKDIARKQVFKNTGWLLTIFPIVGINLYNFGHMFVNSSAKTTWFYFLLNWTVRMLGANGYTHQITWIAIWAIYVVFYIIRGFQTLASIYLTYATNLDISPVWKKSFIRIWRNITLTSTVAELSFCFLFYHWYIFSMVLIFMLLNITRIYVVNKFDKTLLSETIGVHKDVVPPLHAYAVEFAVSALLAILFIVAPYVSFSNSLIQTC